MHSLFEDYRAYWLAGLAITITLILDFAMRRLRHRLAARSNQRDPEKSLPPRTAWLSAVVPPLSLGIWFYGVYIAARILTFEELPERWAPLQHWLENLSGAGAFIAFLWLLARCARMLEAHLNARASRTDSALDDVLLPLVGTALRLILPLLALFFLVRLWPLDDHTVAILRKLSAVVLITSISWLLIRATGLVERAVTQHRDIRKMNDFEGRALVTRVSMLRKIIIVLVGVLAVAAILMLFEEVRDIGRSILASAGIAGIVLGIAAQRSLAGIFAGLQIALTQPIRLGDQVMVANEVGIVEEITLTFAVVRIWDGRRLLVPINHFIENPFVNYSRNSSMQLGVVTLRTDFSLPVAELRAYLRTCAEGSSQWDKNTFAVQVTGALHESMEIRVIASAPTPGAAFDLQCELREKAVDFVRSRYPQCLPKTREEGKPILSGWQGSEEFGPRSDAAARGVPAPHQPPLR